MTRGIETIMGLEKDLKKQALRARITPFAGWDFSRPAKWWHYTTRKNHKFKNAILSGWWFQICFIFTLTWGNDPIGLILSNGLVQPPTSVILRAVFFRNPVSAPIFLTKERPLSWTPPNVPEIGNHLFGSREPDRQVENATAEVFRLQQQERNLGIPMRKGLLDTSDVGWSWNKILEKFKNAYK